MSLKSFCLIIIITFVFFKNKGLGGWKSELEESRCLSRGLCVFPFYTLSVLLLSLPGAMLLWIAKRFVDS